MKQVLALVAPGFEEIETITVVNVLRRAGARVKVAATEPGPLEGARGTQIMEDDLLENIDTSEFDMVFIPGGQPGTTNLQNSERALSLIRFMAENDKPIAAICAAPLVLQSAGVIEGRTLTSHPSVRDQLKNVRYSIDRVVVDGNLITSQGPGTAMELAMRLVEILFGQERMQTVNNGVLAKI